MNSHNICVTVLSYGILLNLVANNVQEKAFGKPIGQLCVER